MKALLLTLLGLVCADLSTTDLSQISGEWKTLYIATNTPEKTTKNGPFRHTAHIINYDAENGDVTYHIFARANGQCLEEYAHGKWVEGNVFVLKYEGATLSVFTDISEDSLVGYNVNVEDNVVSILTFLFSKSNHANDQDFEKFKELTQKMDIPEGNILDFTNIEDCPEN
ncbi:odorant-binding protein-like [Pteronotus mesoamericanus]|uniref:odorant-binding protein-like n=1 Tax=Pteronotus mesoamericanus TaxID=1884717 RepID=UPI0023EB9BBB|nr:odorant-binding protein-like [Pteronotus parnellii mesoamericanus]